MIIIPFLIVVLLLLLVLSLAVKLGIRLYSKNKDYEEVINNLGKKVKGLDKKVKERDATIFQHHREIIKIQYDFNEKLDYFTRRLERQNPPGFIVAGNEALQHSKFLLLPSTPEILTDMRYGRVPKSAMNPKEYRKQTPIYAAGIFSERHPMSDIKQQLTVHLAKYLVDSDFVIFTSGRSNYGDTEIVASINYYK